MVIIPRLQHHPVSLWMGLEKKWVALEGASRALASCPPLPRRPAFRNVCGRWVERNVYAWGSRRQRSAGSSCKTKHVVSFMARSCLKPKYMYMFVHKCMCLKNSDMHYRQDTASSINVHYALQCSCTASNVDA